MIVLTDKTQQDFLNKELAEKMVAANGSIKDNKYWLIEIDGTTYIGCDEDKAIAEENNYPVYPTYSFGELIKKLSKIYSSEGFFDCVGECPIDSVAHLLIKFANH
jgi:hypothetical protein